VLYTNRYSFNKCINLFANITVCQFEPANENFLDWVAPRTPADHAR